MARVVLVVLVCAVGAEDYGGFGVPQYAGGGGSDYAAAPLDASAGAALEDYRGHSPDAPAPLDYKYLEDLPGNSKKLTKDNNQADTWNKPIRNRRKFTRHRKDLELPPDDEDINTVPKVRSDRVQPRRRSRVSSERLRTRERGVRHRRERYEHVIDDDTPHLQYLDKDYFRNDKENILDDDIDTFTQRETTERTVRRKPRDRSHHKLPKRDETNSNEELQPNRRVIEKKIHMDYDEDSGGREGGGGAGPGEERRRPMMPDDDEADQFIEELAGRYKGKSYHDYNEYGDTRRVQNIKEKIPTLLRRTTTMRILVSEPTPPPTPAPMSTPSPATLDLLTLLWTARRAGHGRAPDPTVPESTSAPGADAFTTAAVTTFMPSLKSSETTVELSIAEKSRLSIMKKAQKKDSVKDDASKKPPVLLHVTSNLPTMVMVEPPTSGNPWMRARLVSGDSPRKLDKVKRLMRRKLVADAKSIQDLTDNWDEMVCDYIDVSLLDSATRNELAKVLLCVNIVILLLIQ